METKHIEFAKEIGIAYADEMYVDFANSPEPRWPRFQAFCGRVASVCLFSCFSDEEWLSFTVEQIRELKDVCGKAAIERAGELLDKQKTEGLKEKNKSN